MGGGDSGCDIGLLRFTYIPQIEQHSPFGLMLLHLCLGNVTIICYPCMYVHHYKMHTKGVMLYVKLSLYNR